MADILQLPGAASVRVTNHCARSTYGGKVTPLWKGKKLKSDREKRKCASSAERQEKMAEAVQWLQHLVRRGELASFAFIIRERGEEASHQFGAMGGYLDRPTELLDVLGDVHSKWSLHASGEAPLLL